MNISAGGEQFNISVGTKLNEASQQKAKTELKRFIDTVEKTTGNLKINVKINEAGIKTVIKTIKGDMNELVQVTTKYNKDGKILSQTINRVEKDYKNLSDAAKQAKQSQENLNSTVKHSKSIFDDFIATFMKMAKFNTINLIYDGFVSSVRDAITVVKEFNDVTTEFKKVSDLSGEGLKNYTQQLGELGATVARTTSEMVEGATSFKKSGFTDQESAQLARLAAQFQNIADEELEASEAANILISVMKGFELNVQDVEHIEDAINKVSNTFAVSSTDISQGLGNVAAVSNTTGNSLEETIGMLTAMVEITRSASKSSRGLTQIMTRLTQTLDDSSSKGKKLREIYSGLNISLKDSDGQLRSSYDILQDLAKQWNTLSSDQQQYIALTSAGANQINNFTALMKNFNKAIEATEAAYGSAGSAAEENARYMESMQATITAIQAEFERLILGDGGLEKFTLTLLKCVKGILEFTNAIGGLKGIMTILATVTAIAVIKNFSTISNVIKNVASAVVKFGRSINVFSAFNSYLNAATTATTAYEVAAESATVATALWQAALSSLAIVIGAIVLAVQAYSRAQEEAYQNALNAASTYEQEQKSIAETANKIEDETSSRQELENIIKNQLGDAYDAEAEKLKDINDLRQESLELLYEEAQEKAKETKRTTGSQYDASKQYLEENKTTRITYSSRYGGEYFAVDGTIEERYEKIRQKIDELNKKRDEGNKLTGGEEALLKRLETEYKEMGQKISDAKSIVIAYEEACKTLESTFEEWLNITKDADENFGELTDTVQELAESFGYENYEDFIQALEDAGGSVEDFEDALSNGEDAAREYADSILNNVDALQDMMNLYDEHIQNLNDIQSAYETLTAAAQEYNSTGAFTAETLQKLNQLTAEQMAALDLSNGVATVSVELLQQQFEAEKSECVMKLQIAKNIAIVQLAQQYLNAETKNTNSTLETAQETNAQTAQSYYNLSAAAQDAAKAVRDVQNALGADSDEYKNFVDERDKIVDDYNSMIDAVKNTQMDFSSTSKSSAKATSKAHKDAAKETKDAWKEAFEEEQRQLKHQLETDEITEYEYYERLKELNEKYFGEISGNHEKYIKEYQENEEQIYKGMKSVYDKVKDYLRQAVENGYEKAINAVKKEEEQVLKQIKKQIDALKKEKDQVLKQIQKEIDGLKKQKEEVEKYWNDQIDAIKRENEVLQQQNELLEYQQALQQAKAQKVMVMQDGRFQLGENESAVSQAEANLSNYEDQLSYEQQIQQMEDLRDAQIESIEERIEALEEYKDYMEEYYDEQIEAMEEYYEQVQEQYEAQIDALQAELDAFKEGYQKAEDLDNARLATEVMAANEEAEVWRARLENLAAAVTEYNKLLAMLGEAGVEAASEFSPSMTSHSTIANVGDIDHVIQSRATGDSNFSGDEIALVGESPNTELVLGSKLNRSVNSGELVHLSRGSGVVNAESTSTLAGLLNGLAKPNSSGIGHSTQQNFSFGNITLPNVTDANSFVKTLSTQFNNYAIQYGNNRR